METAIMVHAAVAVWWLVAGMLLVGISNAEIGAKARACIAVFWPIITPVVLAAMVYRLPVKSVRAIRADLHNRALLRDFDRWVRARKEADSKAEGREGES